MVLTVKYKNGEIRNTNLHPSFFEITDFTISQRAVDFAFMHGQDPYEVKVIRGNEIMFEKTYRMNHPEKVKSSPKVDERDLKKQLRKQFKNVGFTEKYIING
jgi:hypothetical protein